MKWFEALKIGFQVLGLIEEAFEEILEKGATDLDLPPIIIKYKGHRLVLHLGIELFSKKPGGRRLSDGED